MHKQRAVVTSIFLLALLVAGMLPSLAATNATTPAPLPFARQASARPAASGDNAATSPSVGKPALPAPVAPLPAGRTADRQVPRSPAAPAVSAAPPTSAATLAPPSEQSSTIGRDLQALAETAHRSSLPGSVPDGTPAAPVAPPARLKIPKLGVDAAVEAVGLTDDGSLGVPQKWEDTAWYDQGPSPGAPGNAVIDGHLDSYTGPAVFIRLRELAPGDQIIVVAADGQSRTFVVTEVLVVAANAAPLQRVFGPATQANLNLITCEGTFNRQKQQYDKRVIVFSTLVSG